MGRFETSREEVSWRSDIISVIIVIKIYVITSSSPAIDKELLTTNNITAFHKCCALENFVDFSFERPEGFRATSLAREAIPKYGATTTKTIFE